MNRFFVSLRLKVSLGLALFSAAVLLTVMFLVEQDVRTSLIQENINKGVGIAHIVALNTEDPLLTGDDIYLFSVVKNALLSPGIRYAIITDRHAQVRAADNMSLVGKPFQQTTTAELIEQTELYQVRRLADGAGTILDIEVPVLSKADRSLHLGNIHLGLSEEIITRAVAKMRRTLLVLTALVLLLGGLASYLFAGLAVRPINVLVDAVRAVGEGNLDQHIDLHRKDEIGVLTTAFNDMTTSLREKEFIKNTFERFVSKPLAQQILLHKDDLRLGGEEKNVTIMFCDLRNFTSLAEHLSPPEVVEFLNMYFTEIVTVVGRHDGMVDKFMGDAIMILFGAPLAVGNEASKALHCAMDIRTTVERINTKLVGSGRQSIAVGIGINSGAVVAGNIGSHNRMEYTVIGDNVNLAARLESLNKLYGTTILLAETTRHGADDAAFTFREIDTVQVVGKKRAVAVYELLNAPQPAIQAPYAEALTLYRQRRFQEALAIFSQLATEKQDAPAAVFADRCRTLLQSPPPADWQGIHIASNK